LVTAVAAPRVARSAENTIDLPGAKSAEGIAAGGGTTFYAGDLGNGHIFRGDIRSDKADRFIEIPEDEDRSAVGMAADVSHELLFVAGDESGKAYVYNTRRRATKAIYQLTDSAPTLINDVTVTQDGAWFTDSYQAQLYFVPINGTGDLGPSTTLALRDRGPAADTSGKYNLNGIVATPDGKTLIVAHTGTGQLYTVNSTTGASVAIAGVSVPSVDGIVLAGRRLWAVLNSRNQIARIELAPDLTSGEVEEFLTCQDFDRPSTAARFDSRLAVVNAKYENDGPATANHFEVVVVSG
jgi:sugar lactone lactonase YvrE